MINYRRNYDPGTGAGDAGGSGADGGNEQEVQTFEALAAKTELTDAEKTQLETLRTKYQQVPVGADGKPLTEDQVKAAKEIQDKITAIEAKPEAERTPEEVKFYLENTEEEQPTKSVYEQVDDLKGYTLQVEYGDVKPDSPEGILLREQALESNAQRAVEQALMERYPRAIEFIRHLASGGKEEEFFAPENKDFLSVTLEKDDKAAHDRIVRTAMALRGNSPDIIDAVITTLKDQNKLYETATKELEALQKDQKTKTDAKTREIAAREAKKTQALDTFVDQLETKIEKGFDGVVIPINDRQKFAQFIAPRINYDVVNDKYTYIKDFNAKEFDKELKVAYFEFKGGDLKGLVERKAESQNARKIKNSIRYTVVPKSTEASASARVPIGEAVKKVTQN